MTLELQYKIKNNPHYKRFLKENSYWYKFLNRDPKSFAKFEEEVKTAYKLRPSDRISQALEAFDMVGTLLSSLKQ